MQSHQNTSIHSLLSPEYTAKCKEGQDGTINCVNLDLRELGLNYKIAYVLENVFSPEECVSLINRSEELGYAPVLSNYGARKGQRVSHRDCYRVLVDDKEFVDIMMERMGHLLPSRFKQHKLIEINERLRFMRYVPGDKFKKHYDAAYTRPDGSATTFITLQTYLNDVPKHDGGSTRFLSTKSSSPNKVPKSIEVQPKAGSVLVFEHRLWHEGSLLTSGNKYTFRTDVLYQLREDERTTR